MQVNVIPTVDALKQEHLISKTIVVIDSLRTTSSMLTAFDRGVERILPAETIGQAKALAEQHPEAVLAGERNAKKIGGFLLGNSPSEWLKQDLRGKVLILTTSNGTKALHKCHKGKKVYIAAFLNAKACAQQVLREGTDVLILCSGRKQQFALEDGLAAGHLITWLQNSTSNLAVDDLGLSMALAYRQCSPVLPKVLEQGSSGRKLKEMGALDDLWWCAQQDIYPFVGQLKDSQIVKVAV